MFSRRSIFITKHHKIYIFLLFIHNIFLLHPHHHTIIRLIYALTDYPPSFFIEKGFLLGLKNNTKSSKFSILFHDIINFCSFLYKFFALSHYKFLLTKQNFCSFFLPPFLCSFISYSNNIHCCRNTLSELLAILYSRYWYLIFILCNGYEKTYDIIIQAQKPHKWTGCTYITPEFCDQCGSMLFYLSEGLKCQGTDTTKNSKNKIRKY